MVSGRTLPLSQWRGRVEEGPYILRSTEYGSPRQVCLHKADRGVFHGKKYSKKSPAVTAGD